MATNNIVPNVSLTYFADVEHHCDHGLTIDGDANSNTRFRGVCGQICKPVVCADVPLLPNTYPLSDGMEEKSSFFGDLSPVSTCQYGFSTSKHDLRCEKAICSHVFL